LEPQALEPQSASPFVFLPTALPGPGHAALDWSATVQPVFAPVQVFGRPGFEAAHSHMAHASLPPHAQAPVALTASNYPVFEVLPSLPMPMQVATLPAPASASLPLPPLPLGGIDAAPPREPGPSAARAIPAATRQPAKSAQAVLPHARQPTARPGAKLPTAVPITAEAHTETPAEREARAQMAKRIGDLIVFLVPLTCLAVVWQTVLPGTWPANTAAIWWPVRLGVLLVAANYLWRFGLAVALRVLLSQRGQTLHTAREPGDPEVWGRLRELFVRIQQGQGAGALNPESAEYRNRAQAVNAGLLAELKALWSSLRESRKILAQRIRVAARDVAHGSAPLEISNIFGGGTGQPPR
jgi:hypothetical protein